MGAEEGVDCRRKTELIADGFRLEADTETARSNSRKWSKADIAIKKG